MKRIIEGKRYDTEKAIEIGGFNNQGVGAATRSDFNWWEATLYKTPRSGRYFLAGQGGPMTRFGKPTGDGKTFGERIIPLSEQEALEWASQYLYPETVEKHFSDLIEDA